MTKYKINAEDIPQEIEAKSLEEAEQVIMQNYISIIEDDKCTCGACEECIQGTEAFNEVNGLNN